MRIKLSEWAKKHKVSYRTAWNYAKSGKIKGLEINEAGSMFVVESDDELLTLIREIYRKVCNNE